MTNNIDQVLAAVLAAAGQMEDLKAKDMALLDMSKVCSYTDYFLLASCGSSLQMRGISNQIESKLRDQGLRPQGMAGYDSSSWLLIDYGDFVIHLFSAEARKHYQLELLWQDAPRIELAEAMTGT